MKTYAKIENSLIINTQLVDIDDILDQNFIWIDISNVNPQPGIGWSHDGQTFTAPIIDPPPIQFVDVTPRQIRQALILSGINLSQIDNAIASLSEPTKSLAQVEWNYSIAFQRHRALVIQVGQMLGWSSNQLDTLWALAASL